jgi:3-oxoacyl-[acyl-carrier-protein] synthase-3
VKTQGVYIAGAAAELPGRTSVDDAVAQGMCDADTQKETGTVSLGVAGDIPAPELAARAVRRALQRSGHAPEDVAALFYGNTWHQGPDGWSPQYYVLREGVGADAAAFELRQGCNAMLAGFDVAASYLKADPARTAAVVSAGDNFGTPGFDRYRSVASALVGDGAAATVLSTRGGFAELLAVNLQSITALEGMERTGEALFPPPVTRGEPMNHRDRVHRYMDSYTDELPPFFSLLLENVPALIRRTLADAGVELSHVRRICHINVTRPYFEELIVKPLGVDTELGCHTFGGTVGHMGGSDPIAAFTHLLETRQLGAGDHVLFFGTAPGHSLACAVARITDQPDWQDHTSA